MAQAPTKARKAADKVVAIGETIALVTLIGFFFAIFLSNVWTHEARSPVFFGDPESIYAEAARAGEGTVVHLPLAVTRECVVVPGETYQLAAQDGQRLTLPAPIGFPDLGAVGVTQPEFRFVATVPAGLSPGPAKMSWRALYDCGLRRVEVITPAIPIEVLP